MSQCHLGFQGVETAYVLCLKTVNQKSAYGTQECGYFDYFRIHARLYSRRPFQVLQDNNRKQKHQQQIKMGFIVFPAPNKLPTRKHQKHQKTMKNDNPKASQTCIEHLGCITLR